MADATSKFGYDRVAAGIIRMIDAEGYKVDQQLPTLDQLRIRFGVSSTTTREAVNILKRRGILESRQGSGLFVRKLPSAGEVESAGDEQEVRDAVNELRRQMRTMAEQIARIEATLQLQEQPDAQPSQRPARPAPKAQP